MMNRVDDYINHFPPTVREILRQIRAVILAAAPAAVEGFAYQMPSYKTNGKPLVYFAAFDRHIGFYATPTGHSAFTAELSQFKQGKGSVQFPLDQPIPYDLIRRMVEYRVAENERL
ncbi:MAG: DUF1801 domain-containing protein [Bacteroidales bacterium]